MASLGSLVIELAANTARLQSDLGKAVGMAERAVGGIKRAFGGLTALAGAGSLTALAMRSIEMGDNLQKAAIKAGIGGKAMSELAHAAKMADVDLTAFSTSLKNMQLRLSEFATGSKAPAQALAALGLTLADIKALSADRQFELIADRISKLKDPADRVRAAVELFGKAGADLLPLFEQGAEGIRKAREEAERLGVAFGPEMLKKLADADDAVKRMKTSWEGFAASITSKVIGPVTLLMGLAHGDTTNLAKPRGLTGEMGKAQVLADLQRQINSLTANAAMDSPEMRRIKADMIASLEERMRRIAEGGGRGGPGRFGATVPGYLPPKDKTTSQKDSLTEFVVTARRLQGDYYEELNALTRTSTEKQILELDRIEASLNRLLEAGIISAETYRARWTEALDEVLTEVEVTAKKIGKPAKDSLDKLSTFAEQAARNIHSHFADFLFDPFAEGLKGMAKGFIDTIRRITAEVAAAKFLKWLGGALSKSSNGFLRGLGDVFGDVFGGARANGGPVSSGKAYLVGERGRPELFVPGTSGRIIPNAGGHIITINNHVDARGATVELARALPGILSRNNEALKYDIIDGLRRGRYALA